ncbi:MAG: KpsF/GutQ family sugar-phosphate isomerase [Hydrogenothermaceae bacterium]|nr:KpsF/GutQ family sugar-phosphate isomerase [Hydrogenothermaceae bacterium]
MGVVVGAVVESRDIIQIGKKVLEEEINALSNLKNNLCESFSKAVEIVLNSRGKVILTGIGKSGIIAQKIASTLSSTGTPSIFLHPAEAIHGDLGVVEKEDVVIAISNSGETPELIAIVPILKRWGNKIILITNKENSTLSRYGDVVVNIHVEREACPLNLAPTSSSTNTLALGDAIAIALLTLKEFKEEDFARFHPGGSLGKRLMRVSQIMKTELPVVNPEIPLKEAIIEISEKRYGATLVIQDSKMLGIITDGDIRRAVKKGFSLDRSLARDVMTVNPKYTTPDSYVLQALELMERYNITVLPVVEKDVPVGIVHIHDILKSGVV